MSDFSQDYIWTDPHFAEITEFAPDPLQGGALENDACGPTSREVCEAALDGRAPTTANMIALRDRDLEAGLFAKGQGQTVDELVMSIHRFEPHRTITLYPNPVNYDTPDHAALANYLVAALSERHSLLILNVGNASAIPGNEGGVHWHFLAACGIRSVSGVISIRIANGDEIPFLGTPRWILLTTLTTANLVAIVEFHRPQGAPNMPSEIVPHGWHYDKVTLIPPTASPIDRQIHAVAHELNQLILTWPNGWPADNIPLEEVHDDTSDVHGVVTRLHQTFSYFQLRATRDNAASPWQPFIGNSGVDLLTQLAQIAQLQDQLAHPVKNPTPATPSPDANAALKAALTDILNRAQTALNK